MPPTPNNVDGIKPPAPAPSGPPLSSTAAPQANVPKTNSVDLRAEAAQVAESAAAQATMAKNRPSVSKKNNGPVITVLLTLIVMVLLIGLAYFAYNKSK